MSGNGEKPQVVQTRKTVAGSDSTFPIPLLTCSVMPVIFAGSMMSFPILVAQFVPKLQEGLIGKVIRALNTSMWFRPDMPKYTVGAALYLILTILFTYFLSGHWFNPVEIADNLKKQGGVIRESAREDRRQITSGRLSRKSSHARQPHYGSGGALIRHLQCGRDRFRRNIQLHLRKRSAGRV